MEKTDIVAIVRTAWETSFTHNWTNLNTVTERGWGPLNYNCLKHLELQLMKTTRDPTNNQPPSAAATSTVAPHQLNLNNGLAGTLMEQIVEYHNHEAARNGENAEDHMHHQQATAREAIAQHKRYHAGMHVACGKF